MKFLESYSLSSFIHAISDSFEHTKPRLAVRLPASRCRIYSRLRYSAASARRSDFIDFHIYYLSLVKLIGQLSFSSATLSTPLAASFFAFAVIYDSVHLNADDCFFLSFEVLLFKDAATATTITSIDRVSRWFLTYIYLRLTIFDIFS